MKKSIIIGASSGMGKELSRLLANHNYKVGATGRRQELLNNLQQEFPENIITSNFDITDSNVISQLDKLVSELGGLDLLIISAGIGEVNEALEFDMDKKIIDLNVSGWTQIVNWAFNYFTRQSYGHLAAITSIAGLRGNRYAPSYNATKSFQQIYLESLRQKAAHARLPIVVTDIRPGFVNTKMAKGHKRFWVAPVDKAAIQIFSAIGRKKKVVYVTRRWEAVALILKILPRWLYEKL